MAVGIYKTCADLRIKTPPSLVGAAGRTNSYGQQA